MNENYHKWYSQYLNREMEMLVFGHGGYPIILFPTAKGRYYECKDFGLIDSISDFIDSAKIKVYCPDGFDSESWYNYKIQPADRVKNYINYELAILYDVIGFAKHETEREKVGLAGCDFGGYHAVNIALKHPNLVDNLISISGLLDIKQFIWGYYDDNCYFNNPPDFLPNLTDEWYLEKIRTMGIILGIGANDEYVFQNKNLSKILTSKNINNWLDIQPSAKHDWEFWKKFFPKYIDTIHY
jgi:esterase/lipase superfamily enzyme